VWCYNGLPKTQQVKVSRMEASTPEDPLGNLTAFADLVDPRDSARCCYPLQELLLVALAGVASGAEDWVDVAYWGRMKLEWLRRWLPFERGIASHDTFNRVFALLDAQQFEACFVRWMQPLCPTLEGAALAIDGKSVRGSRSGEQAMVHLVSLCETASGLTLAQCRTPAKSNEITAVPLLLDMLDVRGATISIDAIGCQREIADKIVECGADFILSAKNNQPNLAQAAQTPFDHSVRDVALGQLQEHITIDQGHARRDTRRCVVTHDLSAMGDAVRELWPAMRSAIMIESTREFLSGKHKGQTSTERRYYISSATLEAEEFNRRIRAHWQIENQCHWLLDVVFHEDDARLHVGHGAHNFAILRRIVLNLIKKEKSTKASVKLKHKRASWSPDYLEMLFGLTPA
jgi:predicted transposase YbfD/YdcC